MIIKLKETGGENIKAKKIAQRYKTKKKGEKNHPVEAIKNNTATVRR